MYFEIRLFMDFYSNELADKTKICSKSRSRKCFSTKNKRKNIQKHFQKPCIFTRLTVIVRNFQEFCRWHGVAILPNEWDNEKKFLYLFVNCFRVFLGRVLTRIVFEKLGKTIFLDFSVSTEAFKQLHSNLCFWWDSFIRHSNWHKW